MANYYESRNFNEFKTKADVGDRRTSNYIMKFLSKYSTAPTNRFCVEFSLPKGVDNYIKKRDPGLTKEILDRIKINCMSVSFPGKSYSLSDSHNSPHEEKVPNAYDLENISLSYNCMVDMKERILFDYWMDYIFDIKARSYMFLNEYSTDFHFFQLDAKNNATFGLIGGRAFPVSVSSSRYDSDQSNTPMRIDVTLAYQYFDTFNYPATNTGIRT